MALIQKPGLNILTMYPPTENKVSRWKLLKLEHKHDRQTDRCKQEHYHVTLVGDNNVYHESNSRKHSRDGWELHRQNASTSHMDIDCLQRRLQSLPLTRWLKCQVTIIDIVPQIGRKVRIHRVLILQRRINRYIFITSDGNTIWIIWTKKCVIIIIIIIINNEND